MSKIAKGIGIGAAIIFTGGAAIGALAFGGVLTGAALATAISTVNALALTAVLGGVSSQFTRKPRAAKVDNSQQQEYAGTVEARRIIYGTALVGGMNVIPPWCSGTKNDYLHQVLALAGHEVNAIPSVYLNQDEITSFGAVSGTVDDGLVSTGDYANRIWIRRYLGTSSQTADFILDNAFTQWTSNHRGRGIAYLALQYQFDSEVYKNGRPQIRALVQGKKCYDPRLDPSPGTNTTNPSYIAYTANPALCLADYLLDANLGLGETAARIDWTLVAAAANVCDEDVAIPPGPSTTEKRYRCSLVLDATDAYEDNVSALANAMRGYCIYSGGKWRMFAGKWQTPDFALTDDDIVGQVEFRTALPYRERWNAVRGQYVDTTQLYQPVEYPVVRVTGDETADGEGPVWKEVNFPACTSVYQAQRDAIVLQKLSRRKKRWQIACGLSAYKIRPGDTGTLTIAELGLSAQSVRCVAWSFTPRGEISPTLDEAGSTDWNDPARADYGTPGAVSVPAPGAMRPDVPAGLTAYPGADSLTLTWTPPINAVPGTTYQVFEHTANSPFSSAVALGPRTTQTIATFSRNDTTTRYYWVVAYFPNGEDSYDETSGAGIPGAALSATAGFRITVSPGNIGKTGTTASNTTGTVTVTPVNPAGSVTYSWTYQSGDASITVSSASASAVTFSRTGMVIETSYSAVWRVSANDGTTTKNYDITVTLSRFSIN